MTIRKDQISDPKEAAKYKSAWRGSTKSSCRRASLPTHLEADKESSDEEGGVLNTMGKRMQDRNRRMFFPLSSPIKGRGKERNDTARKEKRQDVAIGRRGGLDSMGEFVLQRESETERQKLNEQARLNSFDIDDFLDEGDYYDFDEVYKTFEHDTCEMNEAAPQLEERDFIEQQKAEEMLRAEEIEIEYLTANLTL